MQRFRAAIDNTTTLKGGRMRLILYTLLLPYIHHLYFFISQIDSARAIL